MKKILITIAIVLLFSFKLSSIYSQEEGEVGEEFNFDKAHKDYIFNYDLYKKAHTDYLLARSQYLQAKTLASQTKARDATVIFLQTRDEAVVTYLVAVRMRVFESVGLDQTQKDGLIKRLDTEISWFADHKQRIPSAGTLEDLVKDSETASTHFTEVTESIIYESLANVGVGKLDMLREETNKILILSKEKATDINLKGDHDIGVVDRWFIETENKITRSLDKQIEAQGLISAYQGAKLRELNKERNYNDIVFRLQESLQFLKESKEFLKEIVDTFKTKS